ncbi:MAG TPA: PEP-CTERM sorting domain-containing protein [Rariglobus sp.]
MKCSYKSVPSRSFARLAALAAAAIPLVSAQADTLYWTGANATPSSWATLTNWSTDANAATPNPVAAPGFADNVVFNTSVFDGNHIVTTTTTIGANSITFDNTGTTQIQSSSSTARTFNLGAGGITVNSGAGGSNLGNSSATLAVRIEASQTWTNNSTSLLRAHNAVSGPSGADPVTLTIANTNTGQTTFSNALNNGAGGGVVSLVIDSSGSGVVNGPNSSSTYSGGTSIKRGILSSASTTYGTGSLSFDATSGNSATLRVNTTAAVTTNLVANASGGTNTLEFIATTASTYNGNITLNGDLTVGVRNVTNGSTLNGIISGSGDLIKGQYQGTNTTGLLTLGGANTHSGDTTVNVGALTLATTGSLTFYIGANGMTNQVNGASTGAITFNGTFNLNLAGASLVDGNSWTLVNVSNETYGASFSITSFNDNDADNIWTNGSGFSFDEATGVLSYVASTIPEPSTYTLLGGTGALLVALYRRKPQAAPGA